MMRLGVVNVNLAVELELDVVCCLFSLRVAGEGEGAGGEVDFEGFVRDVGRGDCEVDVVFLGVGGR